MEFGDLLHQLRVGDGVGIKRLAPELGVNYTYLSKLESNQARPSEEFIDRVAARFNYDRTRLLLAAQRVPAEIIQILRDNPEAVLLLRERYRKPGASQSEPT